MSTFPILFNGGLIPTYITMTQTLKLKNSIWVLIVVMLASSMNVMIMKNFFRSIPNSLIESARIDGSGGDTHLLYHCRPHFHAVLRHHRFVCGGCLLERLVHLLALY